MSDQGFSGVEEVELAILEFFAAASAEAAHVESGATFIEGEWRGLVRMPGRAIHFRWDIGRLAARNLSGEAVRTDAPIGVLHSLAQVERACDVAEANHRAGKLPLELIPPAGSA